MNTWQGRGRAASSEQFERDGTLAAGGTRPCAPLCVQGTVAWLEPNQAGWRTGSASLFRGDGVETAILGVGMSRRHRKTINPFRVQLQVQRPDWAAIMGDMERPIEVDLGFGRGEFLLEKALREPEVQFVGIEIRAYLIEAMRKRLAQDPRPNVYLVAANVKLHLPILFDPGMVRRFYVHFPDPWTKRKKHHKRRMVDADLVTALYTLLEPGGEVHLMTDKEVVGLEMRALFKAHGGFVNACGEGLFCPSSTTGVRTREELYYINRGDPVYRLQFVCDRRA